MKNFTLSIKIGLLLLFFSSVAHAQLAVGVDFTNSSGTNLNKDLIGTYCPQKWGNASKIYDKTNVLDPLSLPFHKVNLPTDSNIGSDGTWNDITDGGQPSQKTIINQLQSAGVGIHVGMEYIPKSMRSDDNKVSKLFSTSLTKVKTYVESVNPNEEIYYQILNEPELVYNAVSLPWGYATSMSVDNPNEFNLFWQNFEKAYVALATIKGNNSKIKIGGPGFESTRWLTKFMDKLNTTNVTVNGVSGKIKLDFLDYHNYLQWSDATISQSSIQTAIDKMNTFYNAAATYRTNVNSNVKLFCTEYSWLKSPQNSVNNAANNSYRNCARTLELTKAALDKLTKTDRFYWAQCMGQTASFGDDYFTLENYNWDSHNYRYRTGYYAFWLFQRMASSRRSMSYDGNILNGMASAYNDKYYMVLWNKTSSTQTVSLNLSNINSSGYDYKLYLINSNSFNFAFGNSKTPPVTKSGTANSIGNITLEKEATVYIEFTLKPITAPVGQTIWLKANNGKYVTATSDVNNTLWANGNSIGTAQKYLVVDAGEGLVALKSNYNSKYVSCGDNGNYTMKANHTSVTGDDKYTWVDQGGGYISLKNTNYVCSKNGANPMLCDKTVVGSWEKFTWNSTSSSLAAKAIGTNQIKIESQPLGNGVKIYPNPTKNTLNLSLQENLGEALNYKIFNTNGVLLLNNSFSGTQTAVDISALSPGIYVIKVMGTLKSISANFIKE